MISGIDTRVSDMLLDLDYPLTPLITRMLSDVEYGRSVIQILGILSRFKRKMKSKTLSVYLKKRYGAEVSPHRLSWILKDLVDYNVISIDHLAWYNANGSYRVKNTYYLTQDNIQHIRVLTKMQVSKPDIH